MEDLYCTDPTPPLNRGPIVVHNGGGTNSAAALCGLVERGIQPVTILFADTGGEKPKTYAFLDEQDKWLDSHGFPINTRVRYPSRKDKTLEEECLRLQIMPSIVYGRRNCSQKWKIDPQMRYLRREFDGDPVIGVVGFDANEWHRVKPSLKPEIEFIWYPLIGWKWGRNECVAAIQRAGLSLPGKSACFFCPSSKKQEVIQIAQTDPLLFNRALELEARALGKTHSDGSKVLRKIDGLGRHWSWDQLVSGDQRAVQGLNPPELPCMCFDGE